MKGIENEVKLDVRGLACPEPVVRVKNILSSEDIERVRVRTNEEVTVENIQRFARKMGYEFETKQLTDVDEYEVVVTKSERELDMEQEHKEDIVVFITSDLLGSGDRELGDLLMKTFFKTIDDISTTPAKMVFMNSGVRLTTENEETIKYITEIEEMGVEIINCGTCLDYYQLRDELKVGYISNFYEISEVLFNANRVISL